MIISRRHIEQLLRSKHCLHFGEYLDHDIWVTPPPDNLVIRLPKIGPIDIALVEIIALEQLSMGMVNGFTYTPISYLHIAAKSYQIAYDPIDPFNYYVYTKSITIDSTLSGYSGSPIFLKDSKSKKWKMIGTFCAHTDTTNLNERAILYVRREYLKAEIKKD